MAEQAAAIKCKLMRQATEELTDDNDVVNEPHNPLDKSDSFRQDADNRDRHTRGAYPRNIYESNDNNNSESTEWASGDNTRSSGFLRVNNQPFLADIGEDPVPHSDDSVSSTSFLHLPRLSSRDEKIEAFRSIKDKFRSVKEVSKAMRDEGVTECNLIVGIDYTLSNKIQGQRTFGGRCLHDTSQNVVNPYKEVICILGETLEDLKSENAEIVVFGFGKKLVHLTSEKRCTDFGDVLDMYEEVTPTVKLGGPTDFSPLIHEAIKIVERTKQFHVLLIIADGQITKEEETIEAIIKASNYALSIVVIGVGDGPWNVMHEFDDNLPERKFDNFQFVEFHDIKENANNPETEVALMSLMEIPEQFKAITELNLLKDDSNPDS